MVGVYGRGRVVQGSEGGGNCSVEPFIAPCIARVIARFIVPLMIH